MPLDRHKLKALVVVASPDNLANYQLEPFDEDAAVNAVLEGLGRIPAAVLAVNAAEKIGLPTVTEIKRRLTTGEYAFLHLVAYGRVIKDDTILYLSDDKGRATPVEGCLLIDELAKIEQLPHLVFLATCESAKEESGLGNLARRMREQLGTPAVVAMSDQVLVETAAELARSFYNHLARHGEADRALIKALSSLNNSEQLTVPVLYS